MTSHHPSEVDSGAVDSVTSSLRSDYPPHRLHDDLQPYVRFMCSFGGRILPRPHDNQLRYVGGDTRIVSVHRTTTFTSLLTKLSKLSGNTDITVKYQLPNEDLDALISVSTDEDIENMMEEYDRLSHGGNSKTARLRLFLFPIINGSSSGSLGSLLDGSAKREHWFFDALNRSGSAMASLERGRSEVSSIVSEVPDYLFGLDNSDDPRDLKLKNRQSLAENVSVSDPGSPAPVASSPYDSTSSAYVSSIPDLPPVKTKLENPNPAVELKENQMEDFKETGEQSILQQTGYTGNPMWQYLPASQFHSPAVQPVPVYYIPGPMPTGNSHVQPVPMPTQYVQQFQAPVGHYPVGFRQPVHGVGQVYGGGMKPITAMEGYEFPAGMIPEVVNQQVYYGARNPGVMPTYPAAPVPSGAEVQASDTETKIGRVV